jgi:hypothetical protein
MPDFAYGGRRLAHAMMYGHLGEVMSYLARAAQADLTKLSVAVEETWDELVAQAPSAACRKRVCNLRKQADTVGAILWRRIKRAEHTIYVISDAGSPVQERVGG